METYLATELYAINYLQIVWALLNKKYIDKKQSILLSCLLILVIIISFFIRTPYVFLLLFTFFATSAIFIVQRTGSWILMALTPFLINSLVIISWLFTYNLLDIMFQLHYIDAVQRQFLVPFSLLAQQVCLFSLIIVVKKVDKKYMISDSILHIRKSYKLQSMIALFFLAIFALLKQIAVTHFFVESFFYLTILLLTLNLIVYSTAYLYSKYYQEQLKKEVLFEQYNQELEKITISDEFRHDYRNILLSLSDYIEQGENKKALNYIASITDYSRNFLDDDSYEDLGNIPIPSVQGLLLYLIEMCNKEQIKLHLVVPDIIQEHDISIRLIDFLHCLSDLSDFAVKETKNGKEKSLYMIIKKEVNVLYIELTNTTQPENKVAKVTEPLKIPKKYYKENGLSTVIKIVHQYDETDFSLQSSGNHFLALLTL
ncbi:hypothetical protein [Enterococcus caccae]|uniref:Sensor histidine kinase NatK C-terminal domain-containing protein n=1 Tax=Enterococcus caccae ATCC BAA-1240 TaxID=1158612 RepID=R3TYZ5_9ENTE|nr:hypothetical protein [Enterococcus caccae]EOL46403.1 hypothetical protein UC7_01370 [Enterococcus caccae ATCC BAA-1240]EOT60772.1 hypothetical protein I580_01672 [Enterococcus caccae ATCC BAA-1240]